jgi:hypothetical protein
VDVPERLKKLMKEEKCKGSYRYLDENKSSKVTKTYRRENMVNKQVKKLYCAVVESVWS